MVQIEGCLVVGCLVVVDHLSAEIDENEEPTKAPAPDTPTAFQVGGLQPHVLNDAA